MEKMKKGPADVENQLHSWLQNVNGDASISDVFINNELLEASALPPRHILDIHENCREYFGEKILNIGRGNVSLSSDIDIHQGKPRRVDSNGHRKAKSIN